VVRRRGGGGDGEVVLIGSAGYKQLFALNPALDGAYISCSSFTEENKVRLKVSGRRHYNF